MTNNESIRILSESELSQYLHMTKSSIRTLRLQKGLPYFRTANRIFYCLEDVLEWIHAEGKRNAQVLPPAPPKRIYTLD